MNTASRRTGVFLLLVIVGCSGGEQDERAGTGCGAPFTVEGEPVCLGKEAGSRTGRVSLHKTFNGDLNGDGLPDRAVVLVDDSRGSGVFFYLSVALQSPDGGWRSVGDAFLGDRIDVESIGFESRQADAPDRVVVQYRSRGPDEPMSAHPSIETTARWQVTDQGLVPVP